jgi:hypothetical protein
VLLTLGGIGCEFETQIVFRPEGEIEVLASPEGDDGSRMLELHIKG